MKLITLNTWGGRIHKPLLKFFSNHKDIDIFCLQEIYHSASKEIVGSEFWNDAFNLYTDISSVLTNYQGYFRSSFGQGYGLCIFVKQGIEVVEEGDILIYDVPNYVTGGNHPRNMQFIKIVIDNELVTIANVHGLWNGKGKTDTEHRLEQSKKIKNFMDKITGKKILCGDFNLLPTTQSLIMLEENMRNLINEHNVTSTRTSLYTKPDKFADYIFVSPEVSVTNFKVLPHEVSDHSPLFLEFL